MPFKSKSQIRKFYALKARGKMDQATINEWMKDTPKDLPEKIATQIFGETSHITIPAGMLLGAGLGAGAGYLRYDRPDLSTGEMKPYNEDERLQNMKTMALLGGVLGGGAGFAAGKLSKNQWNELYRTIFKGDATKTFDEFQANIAEKITGNRPPPRSETAANYGFETALNVLKLKGTETTKKEVVKQYRTLANKYHPDKGGSSELMIQLNKAKETVYDSPWFQKLAKKFEEKKQKTMFQRVPQARKDILKSVAAANTAGILGLLASAAPKEIPNKAINFAAKAMESSKIKNTDLRPFWMSGKDIGGSQAQADYIGRLFASYGAPMSSKVDPAMLAVYMNSNIGRTAHSIGKAYIDKKVNLPTGVKMLGRIFLPAASVIAGASAAASENELIQKAAPAIAAAGFLPAFLEEGAALIHGTKAVSKHLGNKAALKSLLTSVPSASLGLLPPLAAYYGTKKFLEREEQK